MKIFPWKERQVHTSEEKWRLFPQGKKYKQKDVRLLISLIYSATCEFRLLYTAENKKFSPYLHQGPTHIHTAEHFKYQVTWKKNSFKGRLETKSRILYCKYSVTSNFKNIHTHFWTSRWPWPILLAWPDVQYLTLAYW